MKVTLTLLLAYCGGCGTLTCECFILVVHGIVIFSVELRHTVDASEWADVVEWLEIIASVDNWMLLTKY